MQVRANYRRAAAGTAGMVAVALCVTAAPGRAATMAAKGWQAPVLVSDTKASRETSLALSPTDPRLMAVCDPSGVPDTRGGQSYFHKSADGGRSWDYLDVETAATDTRTYAPEGGDCDVAFDQGGTMYTADTWLGDLSVGHSTDRGESWQGTAVATTSPVVDRPWLVGGPKGTVYLSYQGLQCCTPSAMWFAKSTDYGATFSPAVPITTANPEGAYTWEGNFVVSKSGRDVYLVYSRRVTPGLTNVDNDSGNETIWVAASHDGGTTWTSHLVAVLAQRTASIYPSIAMDAAGYLHVVYSSPRDADTPVWYTMSKGKGVPGTWTAPKVLAPGTTGVAPWIAGGKAGQAAVVWLGSPTADAIGDDEADWYFYWARVGQAKGKTTVRTGRTTTRPIYTGSQIAPEFEMVRLDAKGKMHIGMSVYRETGSSAAWALYYQREA